MSAVSATHMKRSSSVPFALLLGAVLTMTACKDAEETRKAQAAERAKVRAGLAKTGTRAATPAGGSAPNRATRTDSGPPFERMAGYVVRGTDESSFRRCGSKQILYIRASGESAVHVASRYRFKAPTPLSAVYFVFQARVVDDTVSIGDHTYTSVLEVRSVFPEEQLGTPECPAPMRGSMIANR